MKTKIFFIALMVTESAHIVCADKNLALMGPRSVKEVEIQQYIKQYRLEKEAAKARQEALEREATEVSPEEANAAIQVIENLTITRAIFYSADGSYCDEVTIQDPNTKKAITLNCASSKGRDKVGVFAGFILSASCNFNQDLLPKTVINRATDKESHKQINVLFADPNTSKRIVSIIL